MNDKLSFENTELAFKHKSNKELRFTIFILKLMGQPWLVKLFSSLTLLALKLHLPISGIIKATIFRQFCGGESLEASQASVAMLRKNNVEAILDYSIEGQNSEKAFDNTKSELLRLIDNAKRFSKDPTACMKITGIARFDLLEKLTERPDDLSATEKEEWARVKQRVEEICQKGFDLDVRIYIDAEDSWIQGAIDHLAVEMIRAFNKKRAIVYTTAQLYRHDRLAYSESLIAAAKKESFILGIKLVRGAYMEKEKERALDRNYPSPIQSSKENTDKDYNTCLKLVVDNIEHVELCAGTHNENSCLYLTELMEEKGLERSHPHIYFSQLFGMSDNISYNLSSNGYNVSKYLPYGPVRDTLPYLIRRAEENTAIAGQMGKELQLVIAEKKRRSKA